MTKSQTQTLLITLLLACIINAKILVLDMEDLRQLSASENPNLLRSLLSPGNAAHKRRVCMGIDGSRWMGMIDEGNHVCRMFKCRNQLNLQPNTRDIECMAIF